MKFNEFIEYVKKSNGVDTDGSYAHQCMDLYNFYCKNVLEIEGKTGCDYANLIVNNNNVMDKVEKINNYPEFVPQKGDIAVWLGGEHGHVAICLGIGDTNTFKTIDQNFSKYRELTEEIHNYTYMSPLVFLRPKNQKNIIDEFTVRVDKDLAMVSSQPTSHSNIAGTGKLYKGDEFIAVEVVKGEDPFNDGRNFWYKSKKGNYVWAWGLTKF